MSLPDKVWVHTRLLALYQRAQQYAELLDAAGNSERAYDVRRECEAVALHHDLDRILTGSIK